MKNIRKFFACLLLISVIACTLSACAVLSDAQKLQEYDFDSDKIPTINAQVGERKVTGVESGTTNGTPQKQYTYESATVFDDLMAYTAYLRDNGWIVTEDYDLNTTPGNAQLAKESADAGKILILSIAYEEAKYAVKITKTEGTLNENG